MRRRDKCVPNIFIFGIVENLFKILQIGPSDSWLESPKCQTCPILSRSRRTKLVDVSVMQCCLFVWPSGSLIFRSWNNWNFAIKKICDTLEISFWSRFKLCKSNVWGQTAEQTGKIALQTHLSIRYWTNLNVCNNMSYIWNWFYQLWSAKCGTILAFLEAQPAAGWT